MMHYLVGPLSAIAKESGLLAKGRHIIIEGFQQESDWIWFLVGQSHLAEIQEVHYRGTGLEAGILFGGQL